MPRCPNCSYILVLLEKRRRYKCSKCGKLFLQKKIDFKEFRQQNRVQRERDKAALQQTKRRRKKNELDKSQTRLTKWLNLDYTKEYYQKNKATILAKKKLYRQKTKDKSNKWRKQYRYNNIERTRMLARIHYFRQQQVKLANHELQVKGFPPDLNDSFSTFGLSDLLILDSSASGT